MPTRGADGIRRPRIAVADDLGDFARGFAGRIAGQFGAFGLDEPEVIPIEGRREAVDRIRTDGIDLLVADYAWELTNEEFRGAVFEEIASAAVETGIPMVVITGHAEEVEVLKSRGYRVFLKEMEDEDKCIRYMMSEVLRIAALQGVRGWRIADQEEEMISEAVRPYRFAIRVMLAVAAVLAVELAAVAYSLIPR